MACYCANYYGSINCHNTVAKFGDRCALCQSSYHSAAVSRTLQNGVSKASDHWVESSKREQGRRDEERHRRQRVARTASS